MAEQHLLVPEKGCVVVLLGPPGGGKGTQAKKLVEAFQMKHVSVGDVLRAEVKKGSELGTKVKELMAAGELVPDGLVGEIIKNVLCDGSGSAVLLDGYPRNLAQAEFLDAITSSIPVYAVNIDVEEGQVIRRLSGRRFCSECGNIYNTYFSPPVRPGICDNCGAELLRRPDDREEVITERLRVYREQTRPVIDFYRSNAHYFEVDGNWEPQVVFEELKGVVKAFPS
jgi:adenylate kinase